MKIKVPKASMELTWKPFLVDLNLVNVWARLHGGDNCTGISGEKQITIHFIEEPTQEVRTSIQSYWDLLTETSEEATSYQSSAQLEIISASNKAAKLVSATTKLLALGLTADEVSALLG